jgi:hypothetical protein
VIDSQQEEQGQDRDRGSQQMAMEKMKGTAEEHIGTFTKQAEDQLDSFSRSAEVQMDTFTKSAIEMKGTAEVQMDTFTKSAIEMKGTAEERMGTLTKQAEEYVQSVTAMGGEALQGHHHAASFITRSSSTQSQVVVPAVQLEAEAAITEVDKVVFESATTTDTVITKQPLTTDQQQTSTTSSSSQSFVIPRDQVNVLFKVGEEQKQKIVNDFGVYCGSVIMLTSIPWMAAMSALQTLQKFSFTKNLDPQRALYDTTGKIWARTWLSLANSYPEITGDVDLVAKNGSLDSLGGPVMFVANHASWLDIPILCCALNPVFKFIAKGELRDVPGIGQQLAGVS